MEHKGIKLEANNRESTRKSPSTGISPNTWKLNNIVLNNMWVKEEKKKLKKIYRTE